MIAGVESDLTSELGSARTAEIGSVQVFELRSARASELERSCLVGKCFGY